MPEYTGPALIPLHSTGAESSAVHGVEYPLDMFRGHLVEPQLTDDVPEVEPVPSQKSRASVS
jgi:hypothetical protein